jgi:TetR/AcrR family transcriptional regulator, transcriptional repressor for nem operon
MATRSERKVKSRDRILESAGTLIREQGISATSVSSVMEGAGMTVGGFYAHFPSKESMVAEALEAALRESHAPLTAGLEDKSGAEVIEAVSRRYLSRAHRDNPEHGCPIPATAAEVARAQGPARDAFAGEIDSLADQLESKYNEAGVDSSREEALAALSLMVGGLTLARSLAGTPLSDEVLKACRKHIARSASGS